jgi:hypothetical protein
MKYYVIFESEEELEDKEVNVEGNIVQIHKLPSIQPVPAYNFESYSVGVAKGYNYCLEDIQHIPHGKYDPNTDDLREVGDENNRM